MKNISNQLSEGWVFSHRKMWNHVSSSMFSLTSPNQISDTYDDDECQNNFNQPDNRVFH